MQSAINLKYLPDKSQERKFEMTSWKDLTTIYYK